MLRQLIIGLMKVLLDLQIILSLIVGVLVIAGTLKFGGYGGYWAIGEIILGAFGLVALFGLLSLLIEINQNLICLRDTISVRRAPMDPQANWPQQPPVRI